MASPRVLRVRLLLNRLIAALVAAFNRNPWTWERLVFLPRHPKVRWYEEDGIWTQHSQPFLDTPEFQRAYRRAAKAADHGIAWRLHTNLWAATHAERLDGVFVECGTARGFYASGICEYLGWQDRPYYLCDTFSPFMPGTDGSQESGSRGLGYADGPEGVASNFEEWPGVQLIVGRVPDSLNQIPDGPIAYLHVDMNHPEAEAAAVRTLWPRVTPGGIMLFDDYGFPTFQASMASFDALAQELGFTILCSPTGQGIVVK